MGEEAACEPELVGVLAVLNRRTLGDADAMGELGLAICDECCGDCDNCEE
jgi:hypothetical protein